MTVVVMLIVAIGVLLWNLLKVLLFILFLPLILPRMGFLWLFHRNHLKGITRFVGAVQWIEIVYNPNCERCTGKAKAWEIAGDVLLIPTDDQATAKVLRTRCSQHGNLLEPLGLYRGVDCKGPVCRACIDSYLDTGTVWAERPFYATLTGGRVDAGLEAHGRELPPQFRH